jgi:hypothetical protein
MDNERQWKTNKKQMIVTAELTQSIKKILGKKHFCEAVKVHEIYWIFKVLTFFTF